MEDGGRNSAGASARREQERRRRNRQAQLRTRHPRLGGLLMALQAPPSSERNWLTGAIGEELVAAALDTRCHDGVVVMHDRQRPGSRANIDHMAVTPSGVWVVDAKRYRGRKVRVARPLLGTPRLMVDGRDRSKLVDSLARQVEAVAAVARPAMADAPIHGAFCFVDADLPLLGTPTIADFQLLGRRSLVKRLNADGPLLAADIERLARALAHGFPPAAS